ncbi:iron chelate uptake ABC transporter family permease subunit [Staphylococcus pseudintermedius]|uniref:FecCD family ABC transporter permease n=2 Tax=Staphylococcus pseudintermedius TaxID=283734 RepID=UPI0007B238CA|nr:iron ABC transporter permease [Staphylococcus pseudintermedius]EGQ0376991.1 iron ABC transporter permease [Staphylococcus pseudintermedius]EGQ0381511.1 iron ABC transporter permease [Staphylococcus pseudintermedius]EGQ0387508.1 iron ABC transporter permease [Staphylococcus pseudintermedius]EGQ1279802.1 iron chelate uptake ABC transporter family permease subunit [Staphylococcus pseudintermedius]EGQ1287395.1 iron chelate uptake ABC transporter family permease subunit [Staphylococcus pseudinte
MKNNVTKGFMSISAWSLLLMVVCTYSLFGRLEWHTPLTSTLVMEVRLPRMLLALFAGMGLTIAGQMFQIILNNPLADSFTLGLANGATVGAAIAVLLGLPFVWVAPLAMVLGMLSLVVVMTIAYTISRGYPTRSLILAGILIGSLLNAVLFLLVQFNPQRLQNIVAYMFGGFGAAEYREAAVVMSVFVIITLIFFMLVPKVKLLQMNTLSSAALGLHVERLSVTVLILATMMSTVIIGFVGVIGFIGMVIPQFVHRLSRGTLPFKMLLNILIGGTAMVLADVLGAQLLDPIQLPASVVLAILGIPLMFYLMIVERP